MTKPTVVIPIDIRRVETIDVSRPTLNLNSRNNATVYAVTSDYDGEQEITTIAVNSGRFFVSIARPGAKLEKADTNDLQAILDTLRSINPTPMSGVDTIVLGHAEHAIERILKRYEK